MIQPDDRAGALKRSAILFCIAAIIIFIEIGLPLILGVVPWQLLLGFIAIVLFVLMCVIIAWTSRQK